jgi:hypothetical protein
MPRKSTKTAPQGENSAQEGESKRSLTQIAQILDEAASKGKPEGLAAKGEEKKKTGRPSKYNPETAEKMCELLSEGVPLREICRMEGMPAWRTVYDWMYRDDALGADGVGLSAAIARAREVGYDAMAEECLIIADTPKIGLKKTFSSGSDEDEDSMTVVEEDMLGHRKLQIETRLKLLAKFNPKKYGDRQILAGDSENPLEVQNDAMTILAAAVKNLELKRQTVNEE